MSLQHILKNSSVSGKEPLASQLANGELSINYHADGPFLCCKDTAGNVRRVAGVWVSATAPSTPFPGELWLDTGITPSQLKVYKDTTDAWVFAGEVNTATATTEGIVRLATNAEAQGGTSTTSAVTPAALQSKISDSTSTTSSTTIASSTAVKAVADTIGAALPKSGGTITGILEIGNAGQLRFEGSSADAYETTLAVEDPTATRTITLPDRSGTVITTGDTGTVATAMVADDAITYAKIQNISATDRLLGRSSAGAGDAEEITCTAAGRALLDDADAAAQRTTLGLGTLATQNGTFSGTSSGTNTGDQTITLTGDVTGSGTGSFAATIATGAVTSAKIADLTIVNADINASAAIAGTKISPDFGSQNVATTGDMTIGDKIIHAGDTNTAIRFPADDTITLETGGAEAIRVDSAGNVLIGTTSTTIDSSNYGITLLAGGRIQASRNINAGLSVGSYYGNLGEAQIRGDGDLENTNNSYGGISDISLKENIVDSSSQWNDLKALQVRKYNFKAETGYNTHTQIGLIAQEVELVSPGLVSESDESIKSVNYSVLYMKAVKALQEAMERIEILEQRLTDAGIA